MTLINRTIQRAIQKATAAHLFVKEFRYNAKDKHLSIYFFDSNAAFRKVHPLQYGTKWTQFEEFDLWFLLNGEVNQRELARTTLKIALRVLYYDFVKNVSFHYAFKATNEKYECIMDADFCAALVSQAERDKQYDSNFLTKTEYYEK